MMQSEYIETPRSFKAMEAPTKLDFILQQRMHAFLKAKRMRRFTFSFEK